MLTESILIAFLAINHPTEKISVTLDVVAVRKCQGSTPADLLKAAIEPFKVDPLDLQELKRLLTLMELEYVYLDKSAQIVASVTADELTALLRSTLITNAHLSRSV